jgi:hypothetical protein
MLAVSRCFLCKSSEVISGSRWLKPVILATQEVEIRRIEVRSQSSQIVLQTLISKKPITKKGWGSGLRCRP